MLKWRGFVEVRTSAVFLKSKAQHEGRVRAIFKNTALVLTSTNPLHFNAMQKMETH